MNSIKIDATHETPKVHLDKEHGIFEMAGNSLPEDVGAFYNPILNWLDQYAEAPNEETIVNMAFEYYNTSSSKMIFKVLERFRDIHRKGHNVKVLWHYRDDDEDMVEAGEDYAKNLKIPFEFITITA
ncbi:MAG: DUF1987 domain-containing protein [Bacteroidales bacterium]|nr:DUF1987 domain-containing protein [Bacteroidales bacterium]